MKSEASRGLVRMVANYARLGSNLLLGLIFVPFMLRWVGTEAMGLISLLGAGVGIAAMFQEITARSVVRELGAAHHAGDDDHFRRVLNAALAVSAGAAGVVLLLFAVLYAVVPLLTIAPGLVGAARTIVLCQGLFLALSTALSPIFNMLVVQERFVRYNLWILADRTSMLVPALVLAGLGVEDPARGVASWAAGVALMQATLLVLPVAHLLLTEPRLRPRPALVRRAEVGAVTGTLRWYVAVEASNNLYERAGSFLTNGFLGLAGNAVFGVAVQLVNYIGQAAQGVTFGLDAVSARLGTAGDRPLRALVHHTTRLLGLVAFPVALLFLCLARPLVSLWLAGSLDDPARMVPAIATTVQIMCAALAVRAVANGWIAILYGAGHLRRYAPLLLAGAAANPVLTLIALVAAPPEQRLYIVPVVLATVYATVHLGLLPRVAARCLGIRIRDLFAPLARPALATLLAAPVPVAAPWIVEHLGRTWDLAEVAVVAAAFGAAFALLAFAIVLTPAERDRFVRGPLRRLRGR